MTPQTTYAPALALLIYVAAAAPCPADAAEPEPAKPTLKYSIVVTGGELLSGAYPDGHTHFLTQTLRPLGLRCIGSTTVDDNRADLTDALRFAAQKTPLVIVTGGLGPTDNDITRETLAAFTKIPLKENPDALQAMARRFDISPDRLRPNLRRQTQTPSVGRYLKNPNGSAVGLVFEQPERVVVALPGPPRELQPMVRDQLVPYLAGRFGTRLPGCSLTLRFVGLGQSQIDQTLKRHVPLPPDVTLSSQFEAGRVDFTFSLPGDTAKDRARLDEIKQKLARHLGDHIYAADAKTTLEQCVVRLLQARGATLALAESGTAGLLASGITAADTDRRVLAVAYVAPTDDRLRRLLNIPQWPQNTSAAARAKLLATAAAQKTNAPWSVAVGEIQFPLDTSRTPYVEVAVRTPATPAQTQQFPLRTINNSTRLQLTTHLLNHLRQKLLSAPNQ